MWWRVRPDNGSGVVNIAAIALTAALAFVAGFACRKGSICAVLAARELVSEGRSRRMISFLTGSLAAALVTIPLAWTFPGSVELAPSFQLTWWVLLGGAIFGTGALINGGCAFGTLVQIAGGNLSFLAIVPGIAMGYVLAAAIPGHEPRAAEPILALAKPGMAAFVAFATLLAIATALAVLTLRDREISGAAMKRWLRSPDWRPGEATLVMGAVAGFLYAFAGKWTYIDFLSGVSVPASGGLTAMAAAGCAALVSGAVAAALVSGKFKLRGPTPGQGLRSLIGGVLFGIGASFVPGGNDTMVLHLLPALTLHGIAAYGAMLFVLTLVLALAPATAAKAMPRKP
ncbi:MAG: hypothetical protein F9K44_15265 [Hyphomicrobiaceae bacterium]|nr:MAG: hypothetical protein F9K44_15265 [Hyphomicrobiaceae bacterium]